MEAQLTSKSKLTVNEGKFDISNHWLLNENNYIIQNNSPANQIIKL